MKTIMISDEAYGKLASMKDGKSFTELVVELVDRVKTAKLDDIDKFFGIISNEEAERLRKNVAVIRRRMRGRAEARL